MVVEMLNPRKLLVVGTNVRDTSGGKGVHGPGRESLRK
jgi:hypothetical protein